LQIDGARSAEPVGSGQVGKALSLCGRCRSPPFYFAAFEAQLATFILPDETEAGADGKGNHGSGLPHATNLNRQSSMTSGGPSIRASSAASATFTQ